MDPMTVAAIVLEWAASACPTIIAVFGFRGFLLFAWMELIILSFIFPNRYSDRSPDRRSRVGRIAA